MCLTFLGQLSEDKVRNRVQRFGLPLKDGQSGPSGQVSAGESEKEKKRKRELR